MVTAQALAMGWGVTILGVKSVRVACCPGWVSSCPLAVLDVRLQGVQASMAIARKPAWLHAFKAARSWLFLG